MQHHKFPSIENYYREKYIEILKEHEFDNIPYIGSEKIHGSNFSFITDGNSVRVANRSQFTDGMFYNCQSVIDKYEANVLKLKNELYPDADQIIIFGELYGLGIQKGVYYGKQKNFRAFEMRVDDKIIAQLLTTKQLAMYGIPRVPYVDIYPNVYEAIKANPAFNSKVQYLDKELDGDAVNFIEFKDGDNLAEGIVIQPLNALYTNNGKRVMIKIKNKKFTERTKKKQDTSATIELTSLYTPITEMYVNKNRMESVLSKISAPTQKEFGKVIGLMSSDVINDMIADGNLPLNWRKHNIYRPAGKAVTQTVSTFLKEHLLHKL